MRERERERERKKEKKTMELECDRFEARVSMCKIYIADTLVIKEISKF